MYPYVTACRNIYFNIMIHYDKPTGYYGNKYFLDLIILAGHYLFLFFRAV